MHSPSQRYCYLLAKFKIKFLKVSSYIHDTISSNFYFLLSSKKSPKIWPYTEEWEKILDIGRVWGKFWREWSKFGVEGDAFVTLINWIFSQFFFLFNFFAETYKFWYKIFIIRIFWLLFKVSFSIKETASTERIKLKQALTSDSVCVCRLYPPYPRP